MISKPNSHSDLVKWIVEYSSEHGSKLTAIRIVKFLYLCDILSFRFHQKSLTNWPWKFWNYGPFCAESLEAIKEAVQSDFIKPENRKSSYNEEDYVLFSVSDSNQEFISKDISTEIRGKLEHAIKEWGNDTYRLLDFIYFHTEPMIYGKPGSLLDFNTVQPWKSFQEIETKKMNKKAIERAKQIISKMPTPPTSTNPFLFDISEESLIAMDQNNFDSKKMYFNFDLDKTLGKNI